MSQQGLDFLTRRAITTATHKVFRLDVNARFMAILKSPRPLLINVNDNGWSEVDAGLAIPMNAGIIDYVDVQAQDDLPISALFAFSDNGEIIDQSLKVLGGRIPVEIVDKPDTVFVENFQYTIERMFHFDSFGGNAEKLWLVGAADVDLDFKLISLVIEVSTYNSTAKVDYSRGIVRLNKSAPDGIVDVNENMMDHVELKFYDFKNGDVDQVNMITELHLNIEVTKGSLWMDLESWLNDDEVGLTPTAQIKVTVIGQKYTEVV